MALQSSGQIKLSEIAAEFGGSAPHSLSEYHGKGNAPASGEIQLAADFYGTSNYLASGTITPGYTTVKNTNDRSGYSDGSGSGGVSFGSISSNAISGTSVTINAIFETPQGSQKLVLVFSSTFTNWTTLTVNGTSFTRGSESGGGNTNPQYEFGGFSSTPTSFTLI